MAVEIGMGFRGDKEGQILHISGEHPFPARSYREFVFNPDDVGQIGGDIPSDLYPHSVYRQRVPKRLEPLQTEDRSVEYVVLTVALVLAGLKVLFPPKRQRFY